MGYIVNVPELRLSAERVYKKGDSVELSSDLAASLLKKAYIRFGNAEPIKFQFTGESFSAGDKPPAFNAKAAEPPATPEPPNKFIPEGNVDEVKQVIDTIEDISLLDEMLTEEKNDKKRKTLMDAIQKKMAELNKLQEELRKQEEDQQKGTNESGEKQSDEQDVDPDLEEDHEEDPDQDQEDDEYEQGNLPGGLNLSLDPSEVIVNG